MAKVAKAVEERPQPPARGASTKGLTDGNRPWLLRICVPRRRVVLPVLIGFATWLAFSGLPFFASWRPMTRMLLGWDIILGLYIVLSLLMIIRSDTGDIRRQSKLEDESRITILISTVLIPVVCLGSIFVGLHVDPGTARQPLQVLLTFVTVVLSWAAIHTLFAFHYAHEFYAKHRRRSGGLKFPGDERPDYGDFGYFSFVIGLASTVSDVSVTSKPIRRTVILHSILSFVFNVMLLALIINIAVDAI